MTAKEALEALSRRGVRMTPQREIVVRTVFAAKGRHLTAEQVHARVKRSMSRVNLATVYRTLQMLESLGLVEHAHLGHEAATWTPAREGHHHLVCSSCGEVQQLPDPALEPFAAEVEELTGFTLDLSHFAMTGLCGDCR
jgi:Fur family transcriptional regulator, ferric uptake regulator